MAQTNSVAPATNPLNLSGGSTNVTQLENITVVGQLDQARSQILPNLGATAYMHTADQIQSQSLGDNAPVNQIVLRSPGVAQDSAANGDLHVRGEHANLQYRINDVLLPEGITGFGLELDPRFINSRVSSICSPSVTGVCGWSQIVKIPAKPASMAERMNAEAFTRATLMPRE